MISFWAEFEPFLFLIQAITDFGYKLHFKFDDKHYKTLFEESFIEISYYSKIYGLNSNTLS